jgi:hypothetical protein
MLFGLPENGVVIISGSYFNGNEQREGFAVNLE